MPRNGSGVYSGPANSTNPAVANTTISKTDFNALIDDMETALSDSIARDGQTATTAVIPFASGIKADTIAENSANTGVTIDGVLLKDGALTVNESGADVDCRIEGDTDANLLYTDAGNDRVGIGTAAPSTKLDVNGTANATGLSATSTTADATEGPSLDLYRNSASPADNDLIGHINFSAEDESGNKDVYAKILAQILDATGATEDALIAIQTIVNGTLASRLHVGAGVTVGASNDDKGAGTMNAGAYYQDGLLTTQIAQVVNTQSGAVATGTTQIPQDDTIPQNTEGDEYMTLAITPTNASSTLIIDVTWIGSNSVAGASHQTIALFQDSTAGALAVSSIYSAAQSAQLTIPLRHKMTAGTTSATTFKVRSGANAAATTTFNGFGGARKFGGVMASSITITEILP